MNTRHLEDLPADIRGAVVRDLLASHGTAAAAPAHGPDQDRAAARLLVERLHSVAAELRLDGYLKSAAVVEEGAALLDAYQAGLALATPHLLTGYVLQKKDA